MGNVNIKGTNEKKLEKAEYSFGWNIPNFFDQICLENSTDFDFVTSPPFHAGEIDDKPLRWFFKIRALDGKLRLCLVFEKSDWKSNPLENFKISATVGLGNEQYGNRHCFAKLENVAFDLYKENYVWSWNDFVSIGRIHKLKKELQKDHPSDNIDGNAIQVSLHLVIFGKNANIIVYPSWYKQGHNSTISLWNTVCQDYGRFYESGKFSDVRIKCGDDDDAIFNCHKIVLAARSPIFSRMFEAQMSESLSREIVIEDMDAKVMAAIIKYIYTGSVEVPEPYTFFDLIYGAEKYGLDELKNYCFDTLMVDSVTDENVANLTVAAHTFNAQEKVKRTVKEYCQKNMTKLMRDASFRNQLIQCPDAFYDPEKGLTE